MTQAYKGPLDYIDVAARIVEFRTKHPTGSLQCVDLKFLDFAGKAWVVYTAAAYRTPEDERPGIGTAWEPVPGPTQFTRDSEVQNAETAAWGRAMVAALAVDTKKGIASQEEVRNRQVEKTERALAQVEPVQRAAPASVEQLQQIKDGLEMLSPDEKADFAQWWKESGIPKGVDNLSGPQAATVWGHLFDALNGSSGIAEEEPFVTQETPSGPAGAILGAFPGAHEVKNEEPHSKLSPVPNPNGPSQKQIAFIRKMCDQLGVDPYDKASNILSDAVESLGNLTKAQAKKLIDSLIAETGGSK